MSREAAITPHRPGRIPAREPNLHGDSAVARGHSRSLVHWAFLAFVWLTIATSGVVFTEPAPVDALTIMLIVLLPMVGLVRISPILLLYLSLWIVVAAAHVIASHFAIDEGIALRFSLVSLYLYVASFIFAAFLAQNPKAHFSLIFNAWVVAALIAAGAGFIGYFGLIPGTAEIFTKYGRLAGTFKDPNVFGPFVIAPILYLLHLAIYRRLEVAIIALGLCSLLALAVLLSFSRGAWMNLALSAFAYIYLSFVTITQNQQRTRLVGMILLGVSVCACVLAVAIQFDAVGKLLAKRASLEQSYDVGPEGRFGGQKVAAALVVENPLGIGAHSFSGRHHGEDVHNVYLNVALNAGWIGGALYCLLVLLTLGLGLRHIFISGELRSIFLVVFAAFLGTVIEGFIVDTDHWRSFYLLMGLCWGIMSVPDIETIKTTLTQPFKRRRRIIAAA